MLKLNMSHPILRDKSFLKTFWLIAEKSLDNRVEGASSLVKILINRQRLHEETVLTPERGDRLSPEVKYALRRLVRGLASPRNHARLGFAASLGVVLDSIQAIHMTDVSEMMKAELDMSDKGIDPKDVLFGNIFALHAIIQTQRIMREKGSVITKLVSDIKDCMKRKTYVSDICSQALIDLVQKVNEDVFGKYIWPELIADFKGWYESYPDSIALLAVCYDKFPETVTEGFIVQHYGDKDLFGERNFLHITELLVKSTTEYQLPCSVFINVLVAHITKKKGLLATFWRTVVESGLCNQTGHVFMHTCDLIERILPHCKEKDIPTILSPLVVEQLLTRLAKGTNKGANLGNNQLLQFTKNLSSIVAGMKKGSKQMAVVKCLLSSHVFTLFDEITRTKTISTVIGQLNQVASATFLEWVKELFFTEPEKGDLETLRRWISNQLHSMLKSHHILKGEEWVMDVTKFFFLHGFFEKKGASLPVSTEIRELLVGHFYAAVDLLSNCPPFTDPKNEVSEVNTGGKYLGTSADGKLRVLTMVTYAQELLSDNSLECLRPFSEETQQAWDKMLSTVRKIEKNLSKGKKTAASLACQLLFLHIGLQSFSEPEQCTQILQDLQECFQHAMGKRASTTESGEYMEVIVDILLNLLVNSSHLLRTVVELAFKMICTQITEKSLQLILDLFDPDTKKLQAMLADDEDESGEEDELPMEEAEEEDKSEDDDSSPEENGNIGSQGDESESDGDEDMAPVDEAFRQSIKKALGKAAITESGESELETDMTDDAMEGLDSILADIFKLKRKKAAGTENDKHHQIGVFRLRLFHLLEIFVKKNPESPLMISVVFPMLKVSRIPKSQQDETSLSQKAAQLLDTRICKANSAYPHNLNEQQVQSVYGIIEELMKLTRKGRSVTAMSLVSHCMIYMVKILKADQGFDGSLDKVGDLSKVKDLYLLALDNFMTVRTTNLHPGLFFDLIQRLPEIGWLLAGDFGKYIDTAVLPYRQTQACAMLSALCGHPFKGTQDERTTVMSTVQSCFCKALATMQSTSDNKPKPKILKEILLASEQFSLFAHQSEQPPDLSELMSSLTNVRKWNKAKQLEGILTGALNAADNVKKNKKKRKMGKKQQKHQQRSGRQ